MIKKHLELIICIPIIIALLCGMLYYRDMSGRGEIGVAYVPDMAEEASMGLASADGDYYSSYAFEPNLVSDGDEVAMQSLVVNCINQVRAQNGLNALIYDNRIDNYSHVRAEETTRYWSHTRPNGQLGYASVPGYKYAGENLAYVQYDYKPSSAEVATALVASWVNSPAHYSNIVWSDANYTSVYVYSYIDDYGFINYYACNLFMV